MAANFVPSPRSLHHRAAFGQAEVCVADLPLFQIVSLYLDGHAGEGYDTVILDGRTIKEFLTVNLPNEQFYEQGLLIAQYFWDLGYQVSIHGDRVPGAGFTPMGAPSLHICWDPEMIARRGAVCPCWSCALTLQGKFECSGCVQYSAWRKSKK